VIGDGSYFDGPTRREAWNRADLDDWFAAPVSALTFNENVVTLHIVPGAAGESPKVLTIPEGAELPIVNSAMTVEGSPRGSIILSRPDPDGVIELRGEIRVGGAGVWRDLTVSDPPAYAASVLRSVLVGKGIQVMGGSRSVPPGEGYAAGDSHTIAPAFRQGGGERTKVLDIHYSPPLREIIAVVNKKSHNLYAEILLFALGKIRFGEGSFEGGTRTLHDFLVLEVGIPEVELNIDDGSGLSRLNRATPAAFVSLLSFVAAAPYAPTFWATLPEAGLRQELNRMHQSAAAGNLRAKTGTISRVSALSGVVHTAQGEPILFSILSNQVPTSSAKRVEDRIGIQLASTFR
jgi:D-alanyl-D-alanine carboxypeptidase/D-alanyl-D-alanine-endopeptidase (penicillin-binding protein 4)